ncbi:MAG: HAD-IA family hydrolase [Selenomonadaceae bacterium]|nr:HAD-IA family hydrolase [Selenomonadaceae bacterium]
MTSEKYRAAIFDLDGTLINSLEDLADSVNDMLNHFGFPTRSLEETRIAVGNGSRLLIKRSLPPDSSDELIDDALKFYKICYESRLTNKTRPYDGILEMLQKLRDKKIPLGICTNKHHEAAVEIVEKLFPQSTFDSILGDQKNLPRKPDPKKVLMIAEKFGVDPAEVAYFGDSSVDMETAINAGFLPIGVTWGFRDESELVNSGANIVLNHPLELFDRVNF